MDIVKKDFIFQDIKFLKGVGPAISKYLKKKRIEKIKDVILDLPYSETDRSKISKINELEVGKIHTVKVLVRKLNFPRVRSLPNKINCEDETGKIDIVYFNSREGYLKKIFPEKDWVIVSGKVSYFRNKYQITNPEYVTSLDKSDHVVKNIPKYNLTKGLNAKKYRQISERVIQHLPKINDWISEDFIKRNKLINWNECIKKLHNSIEGKDINSKSFRRIAFDEILANFLTLSENRKRIKQNKVRKNFRHKFYDIILDNLSFNWCTSG